MAGRIRHLWQGLAEESFDQRGVEEGSKSKSNITFAVYLLQTQSESLDFNEYIFFFLLATYSGVEYTATNRQIYGSW